MARVKRTLTLFDRIRLFFREPRLLHRIGELFRRNIAFKLLAIVLAVALWAFFQISTNEVNVDMSIPLTFTVGENFHAQAYTLSNEPIEEIQLSIICTPRDRNTLRKNDYKANITLSGETENVIPSYEIELGRDIKYDGPQDLAGRLLVTNFTPSHVRILIDRQIQKNVMVIPTLVGEPAPGYEIVSTNVIPTAVMIEGPARILKDINSVSTEPLNIDGFKKSLEGKKKVVTNNKNIIAVNNAPVQIRIGINAKPVTRTFASFPVSAMGDAGDEYDIEISPAEVSVTVEAHAPLIDALDPSQLTVYVDTRDVQSGQFTLPIKVIPPTGCSIVDVSPENVTVTVNRYINE